MSNCLHFHDSLCNPIVNQQRTEYHVIHIVTVMHIVDFYLAELLVQCGFSTFITLYLFCYSRLIKTYFK